MLKFNSKEINFLYEGLSSLLNNEQYDNEQITKLMDKLKETKRVVDKPLNESFKNTVEPKKELDNSSLNESYSSFDQFLTEYFQIEDTVRLNKQKGFIIGQIEGKNIVMVQGNTYLVDDKELTEYRKRMDLTTLPHMKFDEETQKVLFEQYVRCGIYMGNVPVKLSDCFVKYSSWEKAQADQQVKVLIEGNTSFIKKSQIRLFEDLNDFANPDDYVPGVIVDENTEDALENVLINAIDYTNAIGDADSVKVIRKTPAGTQEMQTMPKVSLKTLSV